VTPEEIEEWQRRFPVGSRVRALGGGFAIKGTIVEPGPVVLPDSTGTHLYVRILRDGDVSKTPISMRLDYCEPLSVVDEIARLDE